MLSILISSYNRLPLFRRTLHSIARNPPSCEYEVVVADEGSTDDILGELRKYSSIFRWKFIKVEIDKLLSEVGVKKFFNNPALTNNIAFNYSTGSFVCLQGNEVIATPNCYNSLLEQVNGEAYQIKFSTTFDIPESILYQLDTYGSNISSNMIRECAKFPLAGKYLHTDVTNYLCLISRNLWNKVGGFNEEYVAGIGKEDSDFIRRCRKIPGWTDEKNMFRANYESLSLHQSHKGRTMYYLPDSNIITQERWKQGEELSKKVWNRWDGTYNNPQPWTPGIVGVTKVVANANLY